ncbi:ShlB/FhaC/HecB family hemolysin secretion/activation protein [Opitutus sp. ER46]|uniref:ShlB/FhaC/HecB family hemolysin secretion/activation protein n=1 Tax=Opitutus sp. ER46 TaxID=2161864 RepID=UPI000D31E151|nr:ShlB/FhaC/HecB family hemolysin secretion/activation protein [Opitutus sp. ER46]PTX92608.1 hypothetical protein DB354_14880 [Opitutus sp. ER46]
MLFRVVTFLALLLSAHAAIGQDVYIFKRLITADTAEAALAYKVDPANPATVVVQNVPVLDDPTFKAIIAPLIGRPIDAPLVNEVRAHISRYVQSHDRMITKVDIPTQTIADGSLRMVVVLGRFKDVAFVGNKWFSSKLLEERLGIKPGDEVRLSVLEEAVNWTNTNPFRQVKVIVNPIGDHPTQANLIVGVQERMPWRFATSIDNYGNEVLGKRHYTAIVQFGNLWGRDHQGSYQFVTTDQPSTYQVHAFNYRIPTTWRHFLEFNASYSRVNPRFGASGEIVQLGISKSAEVRYAIPLRGGEKPVEVWFGTEFKRSNNDYDFAWGLIRDRKEADVIQFNAGISHMRRDKRGSWGFGATVHYSPGGIGALNNNTTYDNTRLLSSPRYVYGTVSIQRQLTLDTWLLSTRLIGQLASTNLLGSEQLAIGGPTSVRGFASIIHAADEGFLFSTELLTPSFTTKLEKLRKTLPPLNTRFAVFYDAGQVFYKMPIGSDPKLTALASVGTGVRLSIASNFSLNFDYGWQLTELPYRGPHSAGHIKAALAF